MKKGESSHTAERVAERRAAHQLLDVPLVFEDPIAFAVLRPGVADSIRRDPQSYNRSVVGRYLRAFLVVRSRVAEDSLAAAIAGGVRQYVVLGAGLDTSALRNPYASDELRVFEVDHPDTQRTKRSRISTAGIPVPDNLTFVAADLAAVPLGPALHAAGFDEARPSFFSWLGVVPYLEPGDIRTVWGYVGSMSGGTTIVFDYAVTPSSMSIPSRLVIGMMARRVAAIGEPWKSYFDPSTISDELHQFGFSSVEILGGDELNRRYFAGRTDGLRVGQGGGIVIASTERRS